MRRAQVSTFPRPLAPPRPRATAQQPTLGRHLYVESECPQLRRQFASLHLAIETLGQGVLEATPQGQIRWATRRARQLLTACTDDQLPADHLPNALRAWVRRQTSLAALVGPKPSSRTITCNDRQILVRLAISSNRCWLFLEERVSELAPAATDPAGLTGRERDVLSWLGEGKSNAHIGQILGISPRTVQKHLERIYQKLGVETRTAAAARARDLVQSQAS